MEKFIDYLKNSLHDTRQALLPTCLYQIVLWGCYYLFMYVLIPYAAMEKILFVAFIGSTLLSVLFFLFVKIERVLAIVVCQIIASTLFTIISISIADAVLDHASFFDWIGLTELAYGFITLFVFLFATLLRYLVCRYKAV